jgi:hypothetical protein
MGPPIVTLPLSKHQHAALEALAREPLTTRELAAAIGTKQGTGGLLQALYQQGLVRYVGGPGVRMGKGHWEVTDRGRERVTP